VKLALVFILTVSSALSAVASVDQVARWHSAEIRKADIIRLDKLVDRYRRTKSRYDRIPDPNSGLPAPSSVLFCLHYRESDNDFRAHAHNGDPLTHRTRNDPAGRLPNKRPPYTFEQSAEDAYYVCDKLQLTNWSSVQSALDRTERFNGYGYRSHGIAAPYNWSGTNLYTRGKFPRDHYFDPMAVDKQLGVAAILKRMIDRGIEIPFAH
jgi:lysozyme family protein